MSREYNYFGEGYLNTLSLKLFFKIFKIQQFSGGKCPTKDEKAAETRIRFNCPPRRMGSSGNYEHDGPWRFSSRQTEDMCTMFIDFYTDLACDHQVIIQALLHC